MKLINLIPNEAKREQKWVKLRKRSIVIVVIVVLYMGGQYYKLQKLDSEVASAQSVVNTVKTLQTSISENQKILDTNMFKLGRIKENYVPLNKMLLFLGTQLDSSIQIAEIVTPEMEQQALDKAAADKAAQPAQPAQPPAQASVPDLTKPNATPSVSAKIDVTQTGITKTDASKTATEPRILVPIQQKVVKLRAVSTSFTAIGDTMVKLQGLDYVANVDMKDVETYYNGFASYQFFEMIITLK